MNSSMASNYSTLLPTTCPSQQDPSVVYITSSTPFGSHSHSFSNSAYTSSSSSSSEDSDDDQGWVQVPSKKSKRQTPRPTPTTTKSKKILCKNFARGGCGYCTYSSRCQFLHPEDGAPFFFEKAREAYEDEMQQLHSKKRVVYGDPVTELEVEIEILQKVMTWNSVNYKDQHCYDLHFITVQGAHLYVRDIIENMAQNDIRSVRLVVGRGNHSFDGVPRVKRMILSQLNGYKGASILVDPSNDGVLIVTI